MQCSTCRDGHALIAASAAECTADRNHPVAFVKDSVITTEIKKYD